MPALDRQSHETHPSAFMANQSFVSVIGSASEWPEHRADSVSGLANSHVQEAGSSRVGKSSKHPKKLTKFRVGSVNVNTLRSRCCEVVEMLSHRCIDVCAVQETRYRNGHRHGEGKGMKIQTVLVG